METRRKTVMIVVLGMVGIVVVLMVGFAYLWTSALSSASMCVNEVIHEERSPDGKRRAIIFERDCGATTRESTQVMILDADAALPNEAGNVFVAYVDPALVRVVGQCELVDLVAAKLARRFDPPSGAESR